MIILLRIDDRITINFNHIVAIDAEGLSNRINIADYGYIYLTDIQTHAINLVLNSIGYIVNEQKKEDRLIVIDLRHYIQQATIALAKIQQGLEDND